MTIRTPVSIDAVSRRFTRGVESIAAINDVSLLLRVGELAVVAGPSGSGKTTLLSIVAGYETIDAGTIRTAYPLPAAPTAELGWRHIAFVPQSVTLLDELTLAENIDLPAYLDPEAHGWPAKELMELLQIDHLADRLPSQTSGGEQQRTSIARALRLRPTLLVADEPTGHQDRAKIILIVDLLRRHAHSGNVVLIASHDQNVITASDRVITLVDGAVANDVTGSALG